ncbi:MAG: cobalt-precorrin-5B (C(1))-methyltransferase [Synergistaceae bacterium]|nr:cobalt-precorrin-5B (C(1))-methyltransferase [Synergistaceae bacterium]
MSLNKNFGVTTGTCAAGASKASAIFITTGIIHGQVSVKNLEGHEFTLKVFHESKNTFGVVKYSGDDKADITDGAKILACVEILDDDEGKIIFTAGEGVGIVTLPGLKVPVGEPAINPVPREMIKRAVREVIPRKSLRVIISVPNGRELAKKTFNPRLGIVGGISILGTTGFVKPMNEQALLQSLSLELNMIYSLGFRELFITFAGTGEKFTRRLFHTETRSIIQTGYYSDKAGNITQADTHSDYVLNETANINTARNIIQCGNYPGYVLDEAAELGFEHVIITGHPGKLLKLAAGSFNTHSKIADGRLEALCTHLALIGAERDFITKIYHSNTTNEAIEIVKSEGFSHVWSNLAEVVSRKCEQRVCERMKVDTFFIDSSGEILGSYASGEKL